MSKSMMLITSSWGNRKTFKMIPTSTDSVYNEAIFDLDSKVLALISKEKKESMHMVAKLNEFGDVQRLKIGKRDNGKDYSEERKTLETFYEYYIETEAEVKEFINLVAINAESFDYTQYLEATPESAPTPNLITSL